MTTPTIRQKDLAKRIASYVTTITRSGGGDEEILTNMYDHMSTFKEILDSSTPDQMDALCERYPEFFRFAQLLEKLARRIQEGVIDIPQQP